MKIALLLAVLLISGCDRLDPNAKATYGDTGLPKNCRAIVDANYQGWRERRFTPEEALDSINRNCGMYGYSWGQ